MQLSLVMQLYLQSSSKLFLYFFPSEVIIGSFECTHCGYENREVQSGAALQDFGVKYILTVEKGKDLDRQVIKSDAGNTERQGGGITLCV